MSYQPVRLYCANNMVYQNNEGYKDNTAGIAIGHVSREERKERNKLAKKISCRRTEDENKIHEKAVKMRKMTDEQLVHYMEDRVEKARSEGYNHGKATAPKHKPVNVGEIITDIGNVKGIGTTKLLEIRKILEVYLEVGTGGKC